MFGGNTVSKSGSIVLLSDTWSFNLETNTWNSIENGVVSARTGHSAVSYKGTTVIFGGLKANSTYSNGLWILNNTVWTQITPDSTGSIPTARANHAAVLVGDNMWVFGGVDETHKYNDLWSFSLVTHIWSSFNPTTKPSAREGASLVVNDAGNTLVLFGGKAGSAYNNDVWNYDITAATWTQQTAASSPSARSDHSAVRVSGGFLVYGGEVGTSSFVGDIWRYTFATSTWAQLTVTGTAPTARGGQATVSVAGGVVVIGGNLPFGFANDVWKFVPGITTSQSGAGYLNGRFQAAAAQRDANNVYIFGGIFNGTYLNDLVSYNVVTGFTGQTTTVQVTPRAQTAIASCSVGLFLFGGIYESTVYSDVWLYSTTQGNWDQRTINGVAPVARYGHTVVTETSNTVLLFGGVTSDGTYLNDVWRYTVNTGVWSQITPSSAAVPAGRKNHVAVKVATGLLVFGGMVDGDNGASPASDLWSFNTATLAWTEVDTDVHPVARYGHVAVLVPGGVLVHGGADASDSALNDAWRYDLANSVWTQITGLTTTARTSAVVGTSGNSIAIFGGRNTNLVNTVDILNLGSTVYVSTTGSDTTGDGSSSKPFATIQQAIPYAPYGSISLQAGTYKGYGNVNIDTATVVQIIGQDGTVIDGTTTSESAFLIRSKLPISISGVTLTNFANSAVWVYGGIATFTRVTFTANKATYGAAINALSQSHVNVVDSTITHNTASSGGAIYAVSSIVAIVHSTVTQNSADQAGGAIHASAGSWVKVTDSTLSFNKAITGGVISANAVGIEFINATLNNNTATSLGGVAHVTTGGTFQVTSSVASQNSANNGGVVYADGSLVTLIRLTAKSNVAATSGGVAYVADTISGAYVEDSTFTSNVAGNGGAVYLSAASATIQTSKFNTNNATLGGALYVTKGSTVRSGYVTFTSNIASRDGGALYISASTAEAAPANFTTNFAQRGGAIFSTGASDVKASGVISGNRATVGGAVGFYDTNAPVFTSATFNNNVAPYGNTTATGVKTLSVVSGPSGAQFSSTSLPTITVNLVDGEGQLVVSDSATLLTVSVSTTTRARAEPVLRGTRTVQAVRGVVVFNDLSVVADQGSNVSLAISSANGDLQLSSAPVAFSVAYCPAGKQYTDGACVDCVAGYFSDSANPTCTACPAGTFSAAGASACSPCAAGTFTGVAGQAQCVACPDGQSSTGGLSACSACPSGTYANTLVGHATCTPCPEGYNSSLPNSAQCLPCPAGYIAPDTGMATCTPCSAGQFAGASGAAACDSCPAGSYSNTGAAACTLCPSGTYSSLPGSPSCSTCGFNRVSTTAGSTSCTPCDVCPPGSYASRTSANFCPTCIACGPGTYSAVSSAVACSPCPRGAFTSGYSSKSCNLCPVGTFAGTPGSVTCNKCPAKSATSTKGSVACAACPSNGYSINGTTCMACPDGALCAGENPLFSVAGYYGGPNTYLQCFAKDNCIGGSRKCATGYTGPLCAVCESGYGRLGTICIECLVGYVAGAWVLGVALAIFFIVHMIIAGRDIRIAQVSGKAVNPRATSIRILINHLQILGWLAILKVRWSAPIQLWFFIFSAIPVMNLSNFALDCTVGLSFYDQFFFFMLLPILTIVGTCILFLVFYWIISGRTSYKLHDFIPHLITANLFIFRYIIPILMLQVWQTVDCVHLDEGDFIAQDTRRTCSSDVNTAAMGIGFVVWIIFVVAAPVTAFVLLMKHRKVLRYETITNYLAFLWLGFRENRHFYEIFNIVKNVILIFFVLLLRRYTPLQQMYAVVWLFIIVLFVFLFLRPYEYPIQNVSEFFATISQFGILITGVIYFDQGQVNTPIYLNVDGVFIALNTLVILGLLITIYFVKQMNYALLPIMRACNGGKDPRLHDDEEKLREKNEKADHSNVVLSVMADSHKPPRSPRREYSSGSDYSYSSRSRSSSITRSSDASRSPYSSDGGRGRSRSPSGSHSSRTDSDVDNRKPRRRSLSLDSRSSSGSDSSASSEYRRGGSGGRQRSGSGSGSSDSQSHTSHSDSSEYGRKGRNNGGGRQRSYSSSSSSSGSSSDDAELRRGPNKDSDEEPLNPQASAKKGKDNNGNYQDMNIGQLINNIEKLLGSEDK